MKLACVVHRYGRDVSGGSEAHCRAIAQRLAETHDVDVLTSCAVDYVSWRNHWPAGESRDGHVRVHRFPVDRPRDLQRFRELSELVFAHRATTAEHIEWFRVNGPSLPGVLDHLATRGADYDRVLFWSYRYAPTWFGLPLVADRAVLVPTAEDDDLIRTSTELGPFFARPRCYLFLTQEERDLVASRSAGPLPAHAIIGSGLEPVTAPPARAPLDALGLPSDFLLYLGRIDRNKGCDRLFDAYRQYDEQAQAAGTAAVPLVLAGPAVLPIPDHPGIRALGFVDEAVREALLAHALALVMPSPYESLSLVVLEAWNHATPVIVNGRCAPLRGQVHRADGGLYYELPAELVEAVRYVQTQRGIAARFGAQGRAYVDREYRWPVVLQKIDALLSR